MANDNVFTILGRMQEQIDRLQKYAYCESSADRLAELVIELENAMLAQQLETSVAHLKALVDGARRDS